MEIHEYIKYRWMGEGVGSGEWVKEWVRDGVWESIAQK